MLILSFFTVSLILSLVQAKAVPYCNAPADVVFILDSSNSIWPPNFTKQLGFVQKLVQKFDIGPGATQTRVGLLTFGHQVWKKFDLKDKMSEFELLQAVKAIEHGRGRTTKTADAIDFAVQHMFTEDAGSRQGVARIAVVVTDGRSQETRRTTKAAKEAQDSGILMFGIGVGKKIDRKELSDIASDPDEDYMYMVDDYNALNSITEMLAAKTCQVTQSPILPSSTTEAATTPIPAEISDQSTEILLNDVIAIAETFYLPESVGAKVIMVQDCGGKPADVYFLIDSSGSIIKSDFHKELTFVKDVVDLFDIAHDKTRVGVIGFSHDADHILTLDNNLSKRELMQTIEEIRHVGGGTYTADALKMMRMDGFAHNVARSNVARIAVVLTDGLSADERQTAKEARLAQKAGIKVFAIGIGSGVDMIEIRNIASDPSDDYVFQVADFASLDAIKDTLAIKTCGVKPLEQKQKDQPACVVKSDTDVIFTYDSAALGEAKSYIISRFISEIVAKLDLTGGFLRVGRITDNCPTGGNFDLSNRLTSADFAEIQFSSFGHLLKRIHRTGFSSEYGGRQGSTPATVMFIDSDMEGLDKETLHAAKSLAKDSELYVIAIGYSPMIDRFSNHISGSNFIQIHSYDVLSNIEKDFLNELCYFFSKTSQTYNIDHVVPV